VWETYVRSWKVATAAEKRALFEASLSAECVYRDPLVRAEGWDALVAYMLAFHKQVPGGHFVTQQFITYGDRSVARWEMQGAGGSVLGDGISYAEYADDGKILTMMGFFEAPA
jgi:hypothetical protein